MLLQMEQANLLEMPEEEFQRLIVEMENSSLFKSLRQKEKIIRYQRFPQTDVSLSFNELKEEVIADKGFLDVESLLMDKEELVCRIKELGLEKFKRYFLYPEPEMTLEDIAQECDLELSEVKKISALIDEYSVMSEFYHPSAYSSDGGIRYSKIVSIVRKPEGFVISYFSPANARGRYSIDYQRFEELCSQGVFDNAEVKAMRQLFRGLELINTRKDTVYRILQSIVEKQALYLESGNSKALLPFTQKDLAQKLELAPSSISRAIRNKSIETPWDEEKALKHFFPRPKKFKKELLQQFLEIENQPLSDEKIKAKLKEKFGVSLSRRSIASLRKELRIPSSRLRKVEGV